MAVAERAQETGVETVPVYQARRGIPWNRWFLRLGLTLLVLALLAGTELGLLYVLRDIDPWRGAERVTADQRVSEWADSLDAAQVSGLLDGLDAHRVLIDQGPSWLLGRPSRIEARFRRDGRALNAVFAVTERHLGVAERVGEGRGTVQRIDGYDVVVDRFATIRRTWDVAVVQCEGVTVRVDDPVADPAVPPEEASLSARTAVDAVRDRCAPAEPLPAEVVQLRVLLDIEMAPEVREALVADWAEVPGVLGAHPVRYEDAARLAASRGPAGTVADRLVDTVLVRVRPGERDAFLRHIDGVSGVASIWDESTDRALVEVRPRADADLVALEEAIRADPEVTMVGFRTEEAARTRFLGTPPAGNLEARPAFQVWLREGGDPQRQAFVERLGQRPDVEGTS
jgi:hypothetical protein